MVGDKGVRQSGRIFGKAQGGRNLRGANGCNSETGKRTGNFDGAGQRGITVTGKGWGRHIGEKMPDRGQTAGVFDWGRHGMWESINDGSTGGAATV